MEITSMQPVVDKSQLVLGLFQLISPV